jgi:hypothetical protein
MAPGRARAAPAPASRQDLPAHDPARTKSAPQVALQAAKQIIEAQKLLLHAGLRVLRVEREAGSPGDMPPASMEEVFDRRVASALERLGMPGAGEFARLVERVESLERTLFPTPRMGRRTTAK